MARPHQRPFEKEVIKMRKTNPRLRKLLDELSEKEENIWKDLARRLSKPKRNMAAVNLSRINRHAKAGDTLLVPGKILGYGNLNKKVIVSAFSFSKEAEEKIKKAGGNIVLIEDLVKNNPKGSKIKILG